MLLLALIKPEIMFLKLLLSLLPLLAVARLSGKIPCEEGGICDNYSSKQDCFDAPFQPIERWSCCVCRMSPPIPPIPPHPPRCYTGGICNDYSSKQDCYDAPFQPIERWSCCVCIKDMSLTVN